MVRFFFGLGALFAFIAVGAGAFGAHLLRTRLDQRLFEVFETAVRYQMYHALALLAVAWYASRFPHPLVNAAGWLFVTGIVVFSGSLYILTLTGVRWLGAVTPIGGTALIAGWACLVLASFLCRNGS